MAVPQVPGLNQLSLTGIQEGEIIEAQHVSQSIQALTGQEPYQITITGSLEVSGSLRTSGSVEFFTVGGPLAEKGNSSTMPNVLIDSDGKLFKGDIGGTSGDKGEKGAQGADGTGAQGADGTQGATGQKGSEGPTGQPGTGTQGATGAKGEPGSQGATGTGAQGATGADGLAATLDAGTTTTGAAGSNATVTNSGTTSAAVFDFSVPQGLKGTKGEPGAGGGSAIILNNNLHYNVLTIGSDLEVYVKGSGNYMGGITWARSTTTLTVNQTAHGLSTGNVVMIRNMSEDYLHGAITVVNTDQFTIDCANSGDTSGTAGAYIPAFSASAVQSSGDVSSITITGCSGAISGSQQIDGVHFYANNQNSSPIALTIPAGLQNGGGANGNKKQITVPLITGTAAGTGTNGSPFSSLKVSSFLSATQNKYNLTGTDEQFGPSLFNVVF